MASNVISILGRRTCHRWLIIGAAMVVMLIVALPKVRGDVYRWRDAKGVVHYDQSLPDVAIANGYEVLNNSGEILHQVPPPPTPSQLAVEKAKAASVARQSAREKAQERYDRMLLRTFDDVSDIKRMRNERLKAIGIQIGLVQDHLQQLTEDGNNSNRSETKTELQTLLRQRRRIQLQFEEAIKRFKELDKTNGASN